MEKSVFTVESQLTTVARKIEIENHHFVHTTGGGVCQVSSPMAKSDLSVEFQLTNIERMMNIENPHLANTIVNIISSKNRHRMLKAVPKM